MPRRRKTRSAAHADAATARHGEAPQPGAALVAERASAGYAERWAAASHVPAVRAVTANAQIQRLLVQRDVAGAPLTLEEIISNLGDVGPPLPVRTVLDAIHRVSPAAALAFYRLPLARERIRGRYNEEDARRLLGAMLRMPYVPGAQASRYQGLDSDERDAVNARINALFVAETGIAGRLDWNDPLDRPFARRWLTLRDDVIDAGTAGRDDDIDDEDELDEDEQDRDEQQLRAELLAMASLPAELQAALEGLSPRLKVSLALDTRFKRELKRVLDDWDEFAGCIEALGGQAPDGEMLLHDATVRAALEQAWTDSNPSAELAQSRADIETGNHEEGGWIYHDLVRNRIVTKRQSAKDHTFFGRDRNGNLSPAISLELPPILDDCVVVGNFHVHPNQDRYAGPSAEDGRSIASAGVPGLLRDSIGDGWYGPARRASLRGHQGYPQ